MVAKIRNKNIGLKLTLNDEAETKEIIIRDIFLTDMKAHMSSI